MLLAEDGALTVADTSFGQISLGAYTMSSKALKVSWQLLDDNAVDLETYIGDLLGERGLWYKMSFFEHACRIPLVVRIPGLAGATTNGSHVGLLDIAPTLLDIAGIDVPAGRFREERVEVAARDAGLGRRRRRDRRRDHLPAIRCRHHRCGCRPRRRLRRR